MPWGAPAGRRREVRSEELVPGGRIIQPQQSARIRGRYSCGGRQSEASSEPMGFVSRVPSLLRVLVVWILSFRGYQRSFYKHRAPEMGKAG
ncbi:hypothetical protein [Dictyobacter formicarum]|uniref:hypothetical protein n=1 Tax=Dictyobacter formicarum TaxID=2778368 RepID=UPI00191508A1|nr:hypothetical protein [Dictyobacter formicarum]